MSIPNLSQFYNPVNLSPKEQKSGPVTPVSELPQNLPKQDQVSQSDLYVSSPQSPVIQQQQQPQTQAVRTSSPTIVEGSLVRESGSPDIYVINPDGTKSLIPSVTNLTSSFGLGALNKVQVVGSGQLQRYTTGNQFGSQINQQIANKGDTRIDATGNRQYFDGTTWQPTTAFTANIPPTINSEVLTQEKTQLPITAQNQIAAGDLIKSDIDAKVYKIQDGEARWIQSADIFNQMGYDWNKIKTVTPDLLSQFKQGKPIDQIVANFDSAVSTYTTYKAEAEKKTEVAEQKKEVETWRSKIIDVLNKLPEVITNWTMSPELVKKREDMKELDLQIAETEGQLATAKNEISKRPIAMGLITGEQAALDRQYNIGLTTMYAKKQALLGDYSTAIQLAQTASDISYKQEMARVTGLQTALGFATADLSEEQAKENTMLTWALETYKAQLEQKKDDAAAKSKAYVDIISKYGTIPGLDTAFNNTGISATQLWDYVAPYAAYQRDLENKKTVATINKLNQPAAGTKPTQTEKQAPYIAAFDAELDKYIGEGGYVDINAYKELRRQFVAAAGSTNVAFDNNFSDRLSPSDRTKYGIASTPGLQVTPEGDVTSSGDFGGIIFDVSGGNIGVK